MALKGLLVQPRRSSSSTVAGVSSKKMALHVAEDSRCFSVLAESQSLHLELPKGGNGRSRREWMDAIAGLDACGVAASALPVTSAEHELGVQQEGKMTVCAEA